MVWRFCDSKTLIHCRSRDLFKCKVKHSGQKQETASWFCSFLFHMQLHLFIHFPLRIRDCFGWRLSHRERRRLGTRPTSSASRAQQQRVSFWIFVFLFSSIGMNTLKSLSHLFFVKSPHYELKQLKPLIKPTEMVSTASLDLNNKRKLDSSPFMTVSFIYSLVCSMCVRESTNFGVIYSHQWSVHSLELSKWNTDTHMITAKQLVWIQLFQVVWKKQFSTSFSFYLQIRSDEVMLG